jgi:hypothetical protein
MLFQYPKCPVTNTIDELDALTGRTLLAKSGAHETAQLSGYQIGNTILRQCQIKYSLVNLCTKLFKDREQFFY